MERAQMIADTEAEDLIMRECEKANGVDEFIVSQWADDYVHECVAHLVNSGSAIAAETADGDIVIQLGAG